MENYSRKKEEEAKEKDALIEKILQRFDKSADGRLKINIILEQKAKSLISEIVKKLGRKIEGIVDCVDIGETEVECRALIKPQLDSDPLMVGPVYGRINEVNYEIGIIKFVDALIIVVKAWI